MKFSPTLIASLLAVVAIVMSACGAADSRTPTSSPAPAPVVARGKGLHFVTGPADGAEVALASARSIPSGNASNVAIRVAPPVANYDVNLDDIAAGKGLKNASATGAYSYLVSGTGAKPMEVSIRPDASGKSQAGSVGMGYGSHALEIAHTKLAGLKEVAAGSFEARLVHQPPGLPTFLWLKSLTDENDLIFPVLWVHADMFRGKIEERLYTDAAFLKIYTPMVKAQSDSWERSGGAP